MGDRTVKSNKDGTVYVLVNSDYSIKALAAKWDAKPGYQGIVMTWYDIPAFSYEDLSGEYDLMRIWNARGGYEVDYRTLTTEDVNNLFFYRTTFFPNMTPNEFLVAYAASTSTSDLLYLKPDQNNTFQYIFYPNTVNHTIKFHDTKLNSPTTYDAWELYENKSTWMAHFIFVKR